MTISSHLMTMSEMATVRIAELKAKLSGFLRRVRGGESLLVLDRDTPVARIEPVRDTEALTVRSAVRPLQSVQRPPALEIGIDVVGMLLDDREIER